MKIYVCIIIGFLFITKAASSQPVVIDASELVNTDGLRYLPDVEGKVLIDEGYLNYFSGVDMMNDITVFPQWPVTRPGSNERGGIFGNLDADPGLELVYPVGAALYAFNTDGTDVDGWPETLDYPTDGAPAFGDIDGDGVGEIVVTTHVSSTFASGKIYAFETDGTDVTGFPVTTVGGGVRSPVLADIDGNGTLEIIIAVRAWPEGLIYVFNGDGTVFPGWPVRMDYIPGSAVAVGDITGDETPEIVAESYYGLHAYRTDGVLLPGFPYYPGLNRVFSYSTPVLADLDDDGNREIICGDHSIQDGSGAVHVVKNDGTSMENWPNYTDSWVYSPPSIGDINDDGFPDVVVGDQMLSASPANKVYAWDATEAEDLPGFPVTGVFGVNSQIILADLDGDDEIELMFDDNTSDGKYPGYNHDGTIMEGWPLVVDGSTFYINPLVVDINLDGIMAISGGGYNQAISSTNLYLWNANVGYNAELAVLPVLQYNTRHNGVFGDYLMVGTQEVPEKTDGGWKIFPNPATTRLTLSPPGIQGNSRLPQNMQIVIYQSSGIKIYGQKFKSAGGDLHFDLRMYPAGIYWIEINSDISLEETIKFILLPH